jgi:hypothetical protein
VAELAKEHGHKLAPAVEAQGVSLGTVLRTAVSNSRRESRICVKCSRLESRLSLLGFMNWFFPNKLTVARPSLLHESKP